VSFKTDDPLQDATKDVTQEHQVRVHKVEALRAKHIEPWPATPQVPNTIRQIIDGFEEGMQTSYEVAGRVVSIRGHGKTTFAHVQDITGKIQIYLRADIVGEAKFALWHDFIDIGDIVWCAGTVFRTKMGEITLQLSDFKLLSKCLYPLPDKFHGLVDVEQRYRQRYLDLISNPESRERFVARSTIIRTIRRFLDEHGYMEVETPMLHPIPGGAAAKPFKTHHNALDMELYLRIAPELYLKRLVVGGFDRVYEINRNFRNEGISTRHNPEFTMLEFYTAYQDYDYAMNMVEKLFRAAVIAVTQSEEIAYGTTRLDFGKPFARLSMEEAVVHYAGCTHDELRPETIDKVLISHRLAGKPGVTSWGQKLCLLFEELVEKKLVQPTFITHFPVEVSPLAKRNAQNPAVTDRFELYMMSMELSNGFTELNDPFDQAARFKEQVNARAAGDVEAHLYDADFIKALEYAMPPTVGVGIGIDRLTMLLTNAASIRDVVLFPTLRHKEE
jgi:lysyl-tRNA synthetase, class II